MSSEDKVDRYSLLPPRLAARAREALRRVQDQQGIEEPFIQKQLLPTWKESYRVIPNDYARSAIFTVRNKRAARRTFLNAPIFVLGKSQIAFTGIELRAADDELVWLQMVNIAKGEALGSWVEFTPYEICKALSWSTSAFYYERLHRSLLRLKASSVTIDSKNIGRVKAIHMLDAYEWKDADDQKLARRRIKLNESLAILFAGSRYTQVEWGSYRQLSPVARRIYDYVASHRKPYPPRLESLYAMCDSDCCHFPRWRQKVASALKELRQLSLVDGHIYGNLVLFNRELSSN
ncbi:MAG: plasmid replication initiator TrfA [Pseudomonadota bacterium]